jgi:LacI family transcriptional regulator
LRDVALRAGVSIGTASHVLNGKGIVSDARRDLVLRAATEIGYRANRLARSLRQRRTHVVGFCAPMISSAYFSAFTEAVHERSAFFEHHVMQVLSGGDPVQEVERVESLLSRQVDGIILMPSAQPAATLDLIAESHVPAVIVDRILPDERFDLVLLDHEAAMRDVIEHLVTLGHERILFIVRHPELVTTRVRIATLLAATGIKPDILATTNEQEHLPTALAPRLSGREAATAVITSNSINTLWTLRTLRGLGIGIPDDVSVVAFDEPAWGELVEPPLTVVRQPTSAIAGNAWRLLMERIAVADAPRSHVMLRNELILRGSTAELRKSRQARRSAR